MIARLGFVSLLAGCVVGVEEPPGGNGGSAPLSREKNLLPWTAAMAFEVSQGHNQGSHTGFGVWAWDFAMPEGTPVLAAHPGTVRAVRSSGTSGGCSPQFADLANYVVIDQGNGYETLYLHLRGAVVTAGARVQRGQLIGTSGNTGYSCGPHLHFQVQRSPSGGGGTGWYNDSVQEFFFDPGYAMDPAPGSRPMSRNAVGVVPREGGGEHDHHHEHAHGPGGPGSGEAALDGAPVAAPVVAPVVDFHGGAGEAWDLAMRAASGD